MMTPEQIKDAAQVMAEAANGKKVQFRQGGDQKWGNASAPLWNWDEYEYRIEPTPREGFINVYVNADGGLFTGSHIFESPEQAKMGKDEYYNHAFVAKFTEVL